MPESAQTKIPVVDFSRWTSQAACSARSHRGVQGGGVVHITNHSLSETFLDEAFDWSARFFELSKNEKPQGPHPEGWVVHRGYSWPGLEKLSQETSDTNNQERARQLREVPDVKVRQAWQRQSRNFPRMLLDDENPSQPNQCNPEHTLPGFRAFMTQFYWECFRVAGEILQALALGLELEDEEYLLKRHSGHNNQLRLLHYPPIPATDLETG
ncbi:thymine dioxygenase [Penicillium alfredii]|uniref:Thymine dioxygenase n=1 Tax=Penicillium alfredii TaxID=1506179 RepID=A0A9W9JYW8_9EURO|nr:thymine dioxygenase [Penicillium alfredii]KAJ5086610.1 thymine dioxygenase [Penicillium alfredii]